MYTPYFEKGKGKWRMIAGQGNDIVVEESVSLFLALVSGLQRKIMHTAQG